MFKTIAILLCHLSPQALCTYISQEYALAVQPESDCPRLSKFDHISSYGILLFFIVPALSFFVVVSGQREQRVISFR